MPDNFFQPAGPGSIGALTVPGGIPTLTDAAQLMLEDEAWARPRRKLETVLALAARNTRTQGLLTLVEQRREQLRDAKSGPDIIAAQAATEGREVTDEETAKAADGIGRAKKALDDDSAALKVSTDASFGGQQVASQCVALVNAIARGNYIISLVDVEPLVGSGKADDARDRAEITARRNAPDHEATVLAEIIRDYDRQAALPSFSLSFGPGRPRFNLAQAFLPVETAGGDVATVDHLAPLVLTANREAVVKQITEQVAEHYRHVRLALSDAEKASSIAEIEARMLARQHREAAAIWAAIERGEDVYFRRGLSPAAVLGIEGGPAIRMRGHDVLDD